MPDRRHTPSGEISGEIARRLSGQAPLGPREEYRLPPEPVDPARAARLEEHLERHPESGIFSRGNAAAVGNFEAQMAQLADMAAEHSGGLLRGPAESIRDHLQDRANLMRDWAGATRPAEQSAAGHLAEGLSGVPFSLAAAVAGMKGVGAAGKAVGIPASSAFTPMATFGGLGYLSGREHGNELQEGLEGAAIGYAFKFLEPYRRSVRAAGLGATSAAMGHSPEEVALMSAFGLLGGRGTSKGRFGPKEKPASAVEQPVHPTFDNEAAFNKQTEHLRTQVKRAFDASHHPNADPRSVPRAIAVLDEHVARGVAGPPGAKPIPEAVSPVGQLAYDLRRQRLDEKLAAAVEVRAGQTSKTGGDKRVAKVQREIAELEADGPRFETTSFSDASPSEWRELSQGMHPDVRAEAQLMRRKMRVVDKRHESGMPETHLGTQVRERQNHRMKQLEQLDGEQRGLRSPEGGQPGSIAESPPSSASARKPHEPPNAETWDPSKARSLHMGEDGEVRIPNEMTVDELRHRMTELTLPGEHTPFVPAAIVKKETDKQIRRIAETMFADTEPVLDRAIHKDLAKVMDDLLVEGKVARNPHRRIFDQMAELAESGTLTSEMTEAVLKRNNMSQQQFAQLFKAEVSQAGRMLGRLGNVEKKFRRMVGRTLTPEESEAIAWSQDPSKYGGMAGMWLRADNLRRGAIVSQLATTMRNAETQMLNVGVHAMTDGLHKGMLKLAHRKALNDGNTERAAKIMAEHDVIKPMYTLMNMITKNKIASKVLGTTPLRPRAGKILDIFPKEQADLKRNFATEVEARAKAGTGVGHRVMSELERGVLKLNTANRVQEFFFRDHTFMAALERRLGRQGVELEEVERLNLTGAIDRKDVEGAVQDALEMTWGRDYSQDATRADGSPNKPERIAGRFIGIVNDMAAGPVRATLYMPFPRFMMNALHWQAKFQPFRIAKLAYSPETWEALASGDPTVTAAMSKSIVGAAMMGAAWEFRNSEYAGEKWNELRFPSGIPALGIEPGSTMDLKPYNPFAAYSFAAELAKKAFSTEGYSAKPFTARDLAMGFASVQLRAGAGMYAMDKFLDRLWKESGGTEKGFADLVDAIAQGDIPEIFDNELMKTGVGSLSAGWSGLAVPMQQLKDITMSYDIARNAEDAESDIVRDVTDDPYLGPWKRKMPFGVDTDMDPVILPTTADPVRTYAPLTRQLTGFSFRKNKTPAMRKLDELGFTQGQIMPSSGVYEYDRALKEAMQKPFDRYVEVLMTNPSFKRAGAIEQAKKLSEQLAKVRNIAKSEVARLKPEVEALRAQSKVPRIDKLKEIRDARRIRERKARQEQKRLRTAS